MTRDVGDTSKFFTLGRILIDAAAIALAFAVTCVWTCPQNRALLAHADLMSLYLVVVAGVWSAVAADQRLFVSRRSESLMGLLFVLTKAYFTAFFVAVFLLALFVREGLEREFLLVFTALAFGALLFFRIAMGLGLWTLRRRGYNHRRIIIIGANERTAHLVEVFLANEQFGYHVEGFLEDDPSRREIIERFNVPWLGTIPELESLLLNRVIDAVYISLPVRSHYETIQSVASLCEGVGVPVRLVADLFPLRLATSDFSRTGDVALLSLALEPEFPARFALRRAADALACIALLLALAPAALLLAGWVRLSSGGPILDTEFRTDEAGRTRRLYRFRTAGPGGSPARAGTLLRRSGLDELPRLLNVLAGTHSLSGPLHQAGTKLKMDSPV